MYPSNVISSTCGNILEENVEAVVNPVNCVGVMGAGLARQFKLAYPDNFIFYAEVCRLGKLSPGRVLVYSRGVMYNPKYIVNFPTKRYWKEPSCLEDIKSGLVSLLETIREFNIKSIAIPPLGCGLGGLDWKIVKPLILETVQQVPDTHVVLFDKTVS